MGRQSIAGNPWYFAVIHLYSQGVPCQKTRAWLRMGGGSLGCPWLTHLCESFFVTFSKTRRRGRHDNLLSTLCLTQYDLLPLWKILATPLSNITWWPHKESIPDLSTRSPATLFPITLLELRVTDISAAAYRFYVSVTHIFFSFSLAPTTGNVNNESRGWLTAGSQGMVKDTAQQDCCYFNDRHHFKSNFGGQKIYINLERRNGTATHISDCM